MNVTILDKKTGTGDGNPGEYAYLSANLSSFTDYYPFGMPMPERNGSSTHYRIGFNGMEKDDEIKGKGNSLDFGARMYDTRLGRWMSLDPLATKYPGLSPYNFVANSPLMFIDPDGRIILLIHNGKTIRYRPGMAIKPTFSKELELTITYLNMIHSITDPIDYSATGDYKTGKFARVSPQEMINFLDQSNSKRLTITIDEHADYSYDPYAGHSGSSDAEGNGATSSNILFDPTLFGRDAKEIHPMVILGHEVGHSFHWATGSKRLIDLKNTEAIGAYEDYDDWEEVRNILGVERTLGLKFNLNTRTNHRFGGFRREKIDKIFDSDLIKNFKNVELPSENVKTPEGQNDKK